MIDWDFIGELEGRRFIGYVPDPTGSESGVTIGTGVDVGNMPATTFSRLPWVLQTMLRPYRGLRGPAAVKALRDQHLALTAAQCATLDSIVHTDEVADMSRTYARATNGTMMFGELPNRAQTVIMSVGFQYGAAELPIKTPHFWAAVVSRDWKATCAILKNFGDDFKTRRLKERDYLLPLVTGEEDAVTAATTDT